MRLAFLAFYCTLMMTTITMADTVTNIGNDKISINKWQDGTKFDIEKPLELQSNKITTNIVDGKLKYSQSNADIEVKTYALTSSEGAENGGTEYEYIWKAKPANNSFSIKMNLTGLVAYYQPPLDKEMNDLTCTPTQCQDSYRPENVVGSYAVYHAFKKHHKQGDINYMAGKAFHIYRPKAVDASGGWTWCEFNKDLDKTGILTTTCPQLFLDLAVYPVKI